MSKIKDISDSTIIQVKLKFVVFFFSGVVTTIITAWGWIYSSINGDLEQVKTNLHDHVETSVDMRGDIRVLLDRTTHLNESFEPEGARPESLTPDE